MSGAPSFMTSLMPVRVLLSQPWSAGCFSRAREVALLAARGRFCSVICCGSVIKSHVCETNFVLVDPALLPSFSVVVCNKKLQPFRILRFVSPILVYAACT